MTGHSCQYIAAKPCRQARDTRAQREPRERRGRLRSRRKGDAESYAQRLFSFAAASVRLAHSVLPHALIGILDMRPHRLLRGVGIAALDRIDNRHVFVEGLEGAARSGTRTVSVQPQLVIEIVEQQTFQALIASKPQDGGMEVVVKCPLVVGGA